MQVRLERAPLTLNAEEEGEGPLVVLLHGFPDIPSTWRHQRPALRAAGWRVLTPWLRGYEPGQRGPFDVRTLAEDLLAWVDARGAGRAVVVGHDWGAVIGYAAAALAPERIQALAALAVPHLGGLGAALRADPAQIRRSLYMLQLQLPGAAGRLVAADGAAIRRLWARWSPGYTPAPGELDAVVRALSQPGVARGIIGYYQYFTRNLGGLRLLRAPVRVPTLALGGQDDGCLGPAFCAAALRERDFPAGLRRVVLPGAGHFLHLERPAEVNQVLLGWLGAPLGAAAVAPVPAGVGPSPRP